MQQNRRVRLSVVVLGFLAFGAMTDARAVDHSVSASIGSFDCRARSVRSGDTITLAAGTRGPLTVRNCVGANGTPITIRNDTRGSGPTIIRRSSGSKNSGFVFVCLNCKHVIVDGMGKWSGAPAGTCGVTGKWALGRSQCGIKVTITAGQPPNTFVSFYGSSSNFTLRGVEIDGEFPRAGISADGAGIGLGVNDNTYKLASYPGADSH